MFLISVMCHSRHDMSCTLKLRPHLLPLSVRCSHSAEMAAAGLNDGRGPEVVPDAWLIE